MSARIRERQESWGTIIYDNLRDEFSAKVFEGCVPVPRSPIGCGWLVTAPCNLVCIHCYGNVEDLPSKRLSTPQQLRWPTKSSARESCDRFSPAVSR